VYGGDMNDEAYEMKPLYGPLPVPGLPVQVQCDGFKCMAFRDKNGRWVDLFSLELLPRVLGVVLAGGGSSAHILTGGTGSGKMQPANPVCPV